MSWELLVNEINRHEIDFSWKQLWMYTNTTRSKSIENGIPSFHFVSSPDSVYIEILIPDGKRDENLGFTWLYGPQTVCAKRGSLSKWSWQKRKQHLGGNTEWAIHTTLLKTVVCFQPLLLCFFVKHWLFSFSVLKTMNGDNSNLLMLIVTELVYIKK